MDLKKRLLRKPGTTVLWLVLTAVMTAFLTTAAALDLSASRLSKTLDEQHTAIAVRTNRAVTAIRTESGTVWKTSERTFTQEDKNWLEALDSVKAVRVNALCGGVSEDFEPLLGLKRQFSWFGSGDKAAYDNAVFVGTVANVRTLGYETQIVLATEEVCALHPEYAPALYTATTDGVNYLVVKAYSEGGGSPAENGDIAAGFFKKGERYILGGNIIAVRFAPAATPGGSVWPPTLYLIDPVEKDGVLLSDTTGYPLAQRLEGDAETFIASHPDWREYRDGLERQLHSLPVIGTERLESLYLFVKNDARIIEGRSFTQEEYNAGARVMVISEGEAQKRGLAVGDTVRMSQFRCEERNASTDINARSGRLSRPSVGELKNVALETENEEFTVVGIYRMTDYWPVGSYDFTADTVFIPRKAQIEDAFGPDSEDIYGVYLSVELVNGKVDDFRLAVAQSKYAGQFFSVEQGFEQVQKNLNGLTFSAQRLLWIAVGAWAIFWLLYLLMYQGAQKNNLGTMRSVGASKRRAEWYLFGSGALVAALGTALGTLLGAAALRAAQGAVLGDTLAQIDASAFSGGMALSEDALTDMVLSSGVSVPQLLLFAAVQLAVTLLFLRLHARSLAVKPPRTLMEV